MKRLGISVVSALVLFTGCGSTEATPGDVTPTQTSAATPSEGEPMPGSDERPDGEVTPDASLSAAEVTELLRIKASDAGTSTSCGPKDVAVSVGPIEAALGHRYSRLILTNTSKTACSVMGHPGLGVRGDWGHTFQLAIEHRDPHSSTLTASQISLDPGTKAFANLEWTGELGGAESEKASMLAIQLAQDQDAFGIPAVAAATGAQSGAGEPLDIGMFTRVRVGPMQLLATDDEPPAPSSSGELRP